MPKGIIVQGTIDEHTISVMFMKYVLFMSGTLGYQNQFSQLNMAI